MVLTWVLKVLQAKGLSEVVLKRLLNLYSHNITIVVINNILGKSFENKRWSIRQGDRPSSILFCYGIDPHLVWLDKRLRGIPIYRMPASGPLPEANQSPLTVTEFFRLIGYIDDVKPAITTMAEFSLVDHGSLLFEQASGCVLHRDPTSGKVKFLPLGRWRGTLTQEDLPVRYIALSEHLDMIGVELRATHTQTRKANGDLVQDRVKKIVGPWRGGKFMPLTMRSHSANTYCLSKVWFKSASVDLRSLDISKINTLVKSWLYADLLEKPEELVLHRNRKLGGLGLVNIKIRALAELIKSFLDTAINPKFRHSLYHRALYDWHIEDIRTIPDPGRPSCYSEDFFKTIKNVKNEGLLRIATLGTGLWYKVLLENLVTTEIDENGFRFKKRCKIESEHPNIDWETTWSIACTPGLTSNSYTFLFKMVHNILPTQQRLHRILPSVASPQCNLCDSHSTSNLAHALFLCDYNSEVGTWLLQIISHVIPRVTPEQVILLNLKIDRQLHLPLAWITSESLDIVWNCRTEKKPCTLFLTRAVLKNNVML